MKKIHKKLLTTTQFGIVTIAVYNLGGYQQAVDTEDIAVEAHKISGDRFAWRKYPDQINLELVRAALSDAKKQKNGALLVGVGRTGWALTPDGLRWARANIRHVLKADLSRKRQDRKAGSIDENRWRREHTRILGTAAWKKWQGKKNHISEQDAEQVFRLDSYSTGDLKSRKITRVTSLFGEDPELRKFIQEMASLLAHSPVS